MLRVKKKKTMLWSFSLLVVLLFGVGSVAFAQPVYEQDVKVAVSNWLRLESEHFGEKLGKEIKEIKLFKGGISGNVGYYLVLLAPSGWVILPADDQIAPIQFFGGGKMSLQEFEDGIWHKTISYNIAPEILIKSAANMLAVRKEISINQKNWAALKNLETGKITSKADLIPLPGDDGTPNPTEPKKRVEPFLRSTGWIQRSPFNYATTLRNFAVDSDPAFLAQINAGTIPNFTYRVGCAPLTIGQIIFHIMTAGDFENLLQNQLGQVDSSPGNITVRVLNNLNDYSPTDGSRGFDKIFSKNTLVGPTVTAYDWDLMQDYNPNLPYGDAHNLPIVTNAIAPLLLDLGIIMNATYHYIDTGASAGNHIFQKMGFKHAYQLSTLREAVIPSGSTNVPFTNEDKKNIVLPNLDIGLPVAASITIISSDHGPGESITAHVVAIDGYAVGRLISDLAQEDPIPYYHLDPGWGPGHTVWTYGLSTSVGVNTNPQGIIVHRLIFNTIPSLEAYNRVGDPAFYTGKQPEIVSGRVVKDNINFPGGYEPVPAAMIAAEWNGGIKYVTNADANGIFALVVPSETDISVNATNENEVAQYTILKFTSKKTVSGTYDRNDIVNKIGNQWNMNLYKYSIAVKAAETSSTRSSKTSLLKARSADDQRPLYYEITSQDLTNSSELNLAAFKTVLIDSDMLYWLQQPSTPAVSEALIKVLNYVRGGGTLLVAGKSDIFAQTLGVSLGLTFFQNTGWKYIYGQHGVNYHRFLNQAFVNMFGTYEMRVESQVPLAQQSVVWNWGRTYPITAAEYVFLELKQDPFESDPANQWYWDAYARYQPTTIDFDCGLGRVIYVNNEMDSYYAEAMYAKPYLEFLVKTLVDTFDRRRISARSLSSKLSSKSAYELSETEQATIKADREYILQSLKKDSLSAKSLPRGKVNNTFFHQMGDRWSNITDKSITELTFVPNVISKDLNLMRVDDDLVIRVKSTREKVTLPDWFTGNSSVSAITLKDGDILSTAKIMELATSSEPDIDITPVSIDLIVSGKDGENSELKGSDKNEMFIGRKGNDTIIGNGGSNIYYYRLGDGDDILMISNSDVSNKNVLRFHTNIDPSDLTVRREANNLLLFVKDGSIEVRDWYVDKIHQLDRVEFYCGVVWDMRDLERLAAGRSLVEREYYVNTVNSDFDVFLENNQPETVESTPETDTSKQDSSSGGCNSISFSIISVMIVFLMGRPAKRRP